MSWAVPTPPPVRLVPERDVTTTSIARLIPIGWTARQGLVLPTTPWNLRRKQWMCVDTVDSESAAQAAITALVRGVGLVIALKLSGNQKRQFIDDLAHAGSVDTGTKPLFEPVHVTLLNALARGDSMAIAADEAHVSLRTANRRIAEVRSHYGVETTVEAVLQWVSREGDAAGFNP